MMERKHIETPIHPTHTVRKDENKNKVDQKEYKDMIRSLLYPTTSRVDKLLVFLCVRLLISS